MSNATPAHIFATTTLARQSTIATQDSQDLNTLKNLQDSQDLHSSPQSLSLESCITKARAVYPLQKNKRLLDESLKLELTRVHFSFIPHVRFNGRVSYQSDVTTYPLIAKL